MRKPGRNVGAVAVASLALAGIAVGCGSDDNGSGDPVAATQSAAAEGHGHKTVAAPQNMSVSLRVPKDSKKGYNAVIRTTGFRFTPAAAGGDDVPGEGHAHLYVDGVQIARPYSSWHWFALEPGMHEVRVTLNANTHAEYARDGEPIAASVMVDVPEDDEEHTHTDGEDPDHGHPADDES